MISTYIQPSRCVFPHAESLEKCEMSSHSQQLFLSISDNVKTTDKIWDTIALKWPLKLVLAGSMCALAQSPIVKGLFIFEPDIENCSEGWS